MFKDPVLTNAWHVAAKSEELKEGKLLAARIMGEDIVLWRSRGKAMAWQDLCIHRGSKISLGRIESDEVICAYHGWTYDNEGKCVRIPANPDQDPPSKAKLKVYDVKETFGLVWVCLGSPCSDLGQFPEWNDNSFRKIYCGPYLVSASAPRIVENFLDVAHLPFVHGGLLGDSRRAKIEDYEVEVTSSGITASGIRIWQPDPDGTGVGTPVVYTYKVYTPMIAYFTKESSKQGFSIFMAVTPVERTVSKMWMIIAMNYSKDVPEKQIRDFEDKVVMQDVRVVESQRPEFLPLDLQAELHLRSDRTAIAYRKWLGQLGLTFGTS